MQQWLQQCYPQHLLSRLIAKFANLRINWLKNSFIRIAIYAFKINMHEVLDNNLNSYASFNEFFIRQLKPEVRPIVAADNAIASPADGCISQFGDVKQGQLLQAKKIYYPLSVLLAGDNDLVSRMQNGEFFTVYLSPRDYHRVHMPIDGRLVKMTYVPGKLFSVNKKSVASIAQLFARNERVICEFLTDAGKMVMVLVGATLVAGIHTVWEGAITPQRIKDILRWRYENKDIVLKRGAEMGHFQFGSTVILLFEPNRLNWHESLRVGHTVKMGQMIASVNA